MIDFLLENKSYIIGVLGLIMAYISGIWGVFIIEIAIYLLAVEFLCQKYPKYRKKVALYLGLILIIIFIVVFFYHYNKGRGCVRILNKQYEQANEFGPLSRAFKKKSGIDVTIMSPNPEQYSEISKEKYGGKGDFPTIFMISGYHDLNKYKMDCYDLTNTGVAKELMNDEFALKGLDGHIYGLGFIVESFGITVNTTLLEDAGYKISDIHSFSDLKHIVQDISARKEKLGFAAFTTGTVGKKSGYYRLANMHQQSLFIMKCRTAVLILKGILRERTWMLFRIMLIYVLIMPPPRAKRQLIARLKMRDGNLRRVRLCFIRMVLGRIKSYKRDWLKIDQVKWL